MCDLFFLLCWSLIFGRRVVSQESTFFLPVNNDIFSDDHSDLDDSFSLTGEPLVDDSLVAPRCGRRTILLY